MPDKTEIVRVKLPNGSVARMEATVVESPTVFEGAVVGEEEERRIAQRCGV
jgi:hypothetical protein